MMLRKHNIVIIIVLQFTVIKMYKHQKSVTKKIWSEKCTKNSMVLNDCNWCRCNAREKYDCKARVCEEIDMFGHFKDAIQEIDVGMEGHGSWRSTRLSCTPGVQYERGAVLCVCDEDGNWPNPVCRDLFQILHSVEVTEWTSLFNNESCNPLQLYLVGCNVCFCPSSGYFDQQLCTNKECQEDDPVLDESNLSSLEVPQHSGNNLEEVLEVYATCDPKYKYELGCRTCDCLRNNRLLCDNCSNTSTDKAYVRENSLRQNPESLCNNQNMRAMFEVDCNTCMCVDIDVKLCTVYTCIHTNITSLKSRFYRKKRNVEWNEVVAPPDVYMCEPGTTFDRDCNVCYCGLLQNGGKYVTCTMRHCGRRSVETTCVEGSFYKRSCMYCHCYVENEVRHEICEVHGNCYKIDKIPPETSVDVTTLDAHKCRCIDDAKSVTCSKVCGVKRTNFKRSVSVDIVPVEMEFNEICPKGHSYKLDCNTCYCLSNGNSICTTAICSNESSLYK